MLFCSIKGANRGYIQVLLATSRNRIYFRRRSSIKISIKQKCLSVLLRAILLKFLLFF
ncbi:hypothetical protein [Cardinium endosymbiont of Tipula unca]|uniref:hypothetical protein n=1 Tax=Cardinium endosymbiont of Tipula unca TaxID=3066216 RepID=UPI0030D0EEC1